MFKTFQKNVGKYGLGVALVGSSSLANAAVDAAVTTAQTDGKADASTVAAGALVIVIAISVFRYMKKAA